MTTEGATNWGIVAGGIVLTWIGNNWVDIIVVTGVIIHALIAIDKWYHERKLREAKAKETP